jgi:hypothetical protein
LNQVSFWLEKPSTRQPLKYNLPNWLKFPLYSAPLARTRLRRPADAISYEQLQQLRGDDE